MVEQKVIDEVVSIIVGFTENGGIGEVIGNDNNSSAVCEYNPNIGDSVGFIEYDRNDEDFQDHLEVLKTLGYLRGQCSNE